MKIITGKTEKEQYRFEVKFQHFKGQAPYFSITGTTWKLGRPKIDRYSISSGALTLGDYVPELAHLDKYHLCSVEMPMHYISNALYHASNRDCWGLLKGEKRQIRNGKTGLPAWEIVAVHIETGEKVELYKLDKSKDAETQPSCDYRLEWQPWCRIGEGKEPDLNAARASAIWPEAELEDFTEEKLKARLPDLIKQFKNDVEVAGIAWPESY